MLIPVIPVSFPHIPQLAPFKMLQEEKVLEEVSAMLLLGELRRRGRGKV